jgi:3-methyladenine DNA glycosylase/8-oxoguanine DNA glycosylase
MTTNLDYAPKALRHLRHKDPVLRPIIQRVGPFKPRAYRSRFEMLAGSIISQQISTKAAAAIQQRLRDLISPQRVTPQAVLRLTPAKLRGAGLSRPKVNYLRGLAADLLKGRIDLESIHEREDEAIIEHLVQVKGIGRWTAEMFLIFSLGRPDVLPVDDFGLRAAIQRCDVLPELPTRAFVRERGAIWAPYRSVATWYLWQSLKSAP